MPRRAQFPPPIYPLTAAPGDPVYARVWQHGRCRDVSLGPKDSEQARTRYAALLTELASGTSRPAEPPPGRPQTVEDLLTLFWVHAEQHYRRPDGTAKQELAGFRDALRPVRRLCGHLPIGEFGPKALKLVQRSMVEGSWRTEAERKTQLAHGRPLRLCRRVVNRNTVRIKTAWKWLASEELISGELFHALATVRGLEDGQYGVHDYEPVPPVAEDLLPWLLGALSPTVRAAAEFQLWTAARPGEALALRPCDLLRTDRVEISRGVCVQTGGRVWVYQPAQHKTRHRGHRRTILIGPRAQEILAPLLAGRNDQAYLFCPRESMESYLRRAGRRVNPARTRRPGECYTTASYGRAFRQACRRLYGPWLTGDRPRAHPHQLRHNAATRMQREFGYEVTRLLLGHRSLAVTQIYVEENLGKALEAVAQAG